MKVKTALLAAALAVGLCACGSQPEAPALLEPVDVVVQTTQVRRGNVYDMAVYEAFTKPETVRCGFLGGGRVAQVLVSRGDRVQAGDPLAVLDTQALEEEKTVLTAQLELLTAQADIAERRYQLETQALTGADAAARAELLRLEYEPKAQEQAAQIAAVEARIAGLDGDAARAVLTAPCAGTVLAVGLTEGENAMGPNAAIYLTDDSRLQVVTEYIEDKVLLSAVRVYATIGGEEYAVTNLPYEREEYLARKMAGEDLESVFQVDDPQGVDAGMYTLLYVVARQAEDTLYLPATAVFQDGAGDYVYVYGPEGQVRRDIETGIRTGAQVEILSGLGEGDEVYVGS